MKKLLSILVGVLLLTSCAHVKDKSWDTTDKVLLVTSTLAVSADTYTTTRMLTNPNNYEMNPIMGKHPSDGRVIATMAVGHALVLLIAHYFPEYRKFLLGSKTMINTGLALQNRELYD